MAKKEQFPSEKLDQYMLRMPDGMRDKIKKAAIDNGRSMNAEIVARLENSFEPITTKADYNALKELIEEAVSQILKRQKSE